MSNSESPFILQQRQGEQGRREAQAAIDVVVKRFQAMLENELPPLWMMNLIGSHSADHFKNTGAWAFVELVRRGAVGPSSHVVDIGSGCGRLALPFSFLIRDGVYFGTDVFAEGIEWCTANITTRNPACRFVFQSPEHNYYFGGEARASETLSLSFADTGSIDFAFANSVFTHLVEDDARRYLSEIARCLKPSGIAWVTSFIIDRSFRRYVEETGLHRMVREVSPGHFQAYEKQDFFAGYEMSRWQTLVADAGLEIAGFDPGTWAAKPGALHYQDTFILTRAPAPEA